MTRAAPRVTLPGALRRARAIIRETAGSVAPGGALVEVGDPSARPCRYTFETDRERFFFRIFFDLQLDPSRDPAGAEPLDREDLVSRTVTSVEAHWRAHPDLTMVPSVVDNEIAPERPSALSQDGSRFSALAMPSESATVRFEVESRCLARRNR